jgi:hypothetical protein
VLLKFSKVIELLCWHACEDLFCHMLQMKTWEIKIIPVPPLAVVVLI